MKKEVKNKLIHLVVLYNEIDILKTRNEEDAVIEVDYDSEDGYKTIHQDKRISDAIDILTERVKEIKEELIKLPESDDSI